MKLIALIQIAITTLLGWGITSAAQLDVQALLRAKTPGWTADCKATGLKDGPGLTMCVNSHRMAYLDGVADGMDKAPAVPMPPTGMTCFEVEPGMVRCN